MTIIVAWRTSFVINRYIKAKSLSFDYTVNEFVLVAADDNIIRLNPSLVMITILEE